MNAHLNPLHDRLAELSLTEMKLIAADDDRAAIANAQISDTLASIEAVLSDDNPLTVANAESYCQRIVPPAVIFESTVELDDAQPVITVWFWLDGYLNHMTVWVETNGQLYGEY